MLFLRIITLTVFLILITLMPMPGIAAPVETTPTIKATPSDTAASAMGVYWAPPLIPLFESPDLKAPVLDVLQWSGKSAGSAGSLVYARQAQRYLPARTPFYWFYPQQNMAWMLTMSDNGGENGHAWYEVVIDQKSGKTAWVPDFTQWQQWVLAPSSGVGPELREKLMAQAGERAGQCWSWLDLMRDFGKRQGVKWVANAPSDARELRTSPEDGGKRIPITYAKKTRLVHIKGNWAMVQISDFDHTQPIGWVRWRSDDGQIFLVPNFG